MTTEELRESIMQALTGMDQSTEALTDRMEILFVSLLAEAQREAFAAGFNLCLTQAATDDWSIDSTAEASRRYPGSHHVENAGRAG